MFGNGGCFCGGLGGGHLRWTWLIEGRRLSRGLKVRRRSSRLTKLFQISDLKFQNRRYRVLPVNRGWQNCRHCLNVSRLFRFRRERNKPNKLQQQWRKQP